MDFLTENCTFRRLTPELANYCENFSCGNNDLDDFFTNEAEDYSSQLFGKSYCFTLDENDKKIVCAFTVSNDSIKISHLSKKKRNKLNRKIPNPKRKNTYPSALIGRLGVNVEFRGNRYGDQMMKFVKSWFLDPKNKTGCRYIVVDAYNEDIALNYYKRNGFQFLFDSENEEKEYTGLRTELTKKEEKINKIYRFFGLNEICKEPLLTRLMYFDLILLKP